MRKGPSDEDRGEQNTKMLESRREREREKKLKEREGPQG